MKNLRAVVAENIYKLRKKNKMTQYELSVKLNYSDKAISRWEKAEVVPDVETLQSIANVFEVSLTYLLEDHNEEENNTISKQVFTVTNRTALMFFSITSILLVATIVFVYINLIYDYVFWQVFVWAVPAICVVGIVFTLIWKTKYFNFMFTSIFIWSLIASIYLQFLSLNLWLIFLIGVPLQCLNIVAEFMIPKQKNKKNNKVIKK